MLCKTNRLSSNMNEIEYGAAIADIFVLDSPSVLSTYTPKLFQDKRPLLSTLGTDFIFLAPTSFAALTVMKQQKQPVYLYQFNHSISFDGWGSRYFFCRGHVCHGSELPFVFHTTGNFSFTNEEEKLSNSMIDYWTNFAKSGDPNVGVSVPRKWDPVTDPNHIPYLILETDSDGGIFEYTNLRYSFVQFWFQLGFHHGW